MKPKAHKPEFCRDDNLRTAPYYEEIPGAVKELLSSYNRSDCYHHMETTPIPSIDSVVQLIEQSRQLLFPGYFTPVTDISVKLEYKLGQEMTHLFEVLSNQIILAFKHDCLRYDRPCANCSGPGREAAISFLKALPKMREILATDVQAALDGDPAAMSTDEVIFSYPGLYAVTVYRIANKLYELNVPLLPRMMSEFAHSHTGIDINPGARIGDSFFYRSWNRRGGRRNYPYRKPGETVPGGDFGRFIFAQRQERSAVSQKTASNHRRRRDYLCEYYCTGWRNDHWRSIRYRR